jgi:cyclic pyranopterin phosphate synthase
VFGIISSTTAPFCRTCDRSRLTADGIWYLCLYAAGGVDLRDALRSGASPADIRSTIEAAWRRRADRGAEERHEERNRRALLPAEELRRDPHLEMHARGG